MSVIVRNLKEMQALDADEEWRAKAKDEALDQLSRKNYTAAKDILLFVIKKKTHDFVAVPSAMHQALARNERPPRPPPRATGERERGRGSFQARGSGLQDEKERARSSMQADRSPGLMASFTKKLMRVPRKSDGDVQAELVLGNVSIEKNGLSGGGGSKRDIGLSDSEFEDRLAPLDIGLGTGFNSSDGSIHSAPHRDRLIFDDLGIEEGPVGAVKEAKSGGTSGLLLVRTASNQTLPAVQLQTVTLRVRITQSVPKNHNQGRRTSVSSMASTSSQFGFDMGTSMQLGNLLHLGNWKKGSKKLVQHAALSWLDSVIMDFVHALNDMDWIIRNDQIQVEQAMQDPEVLFVHLSDTADVGNMACTGAMLAKDFISQSHSKGSLLRRFANENPVKPYDIVSAEQFEISSRGGGDMPSHILPSKQTSREGSREGTADRESRSNDASRRPSAERISPMERGSPRRLSVERGSYADSSRRPSGESWVSTGC